MIITSELFFAGTRSTEQTNGAELLSFEAAVRETLTGLVNFYEALTGLGNLCSANYSAPASRSMPFPEYFTVAKFVYLEDTNNVA